MASQILFVLGGVAVLGGLAASYMTGEPGGVLAGCMGAVALTVIALAERGSR